MDNYIVTLYEQTDSDDVAFPFLVFKRKYDIRLHLSDTFSFLLQPEKWNVCSFSKFQITKLGNGKWYHNSNDSWNSLFICSALSNSRVGQELLFSCCKVLEVTLQRDPAAGSLSSLWKSLDSATLVFIHLGLHQRDRMSSLCFPRNPHARAHHCGSTEPCHLNYLVMPDPSPWSGGRGTVFLKTSFSIRP